MNNQFNPQQISKFQWKVYNLCSQVPRGSITTYKKLASLLKTSPRAVGRVLKINPFHSETVPCHRVIASNFFIGGFRGKWGEGKEIQEKVKKLKKEGIIFNKKGYLLKDLRKKVIFQFD